MSFIQDNLLQREKIVHMVRPHWVIFSSPVWACFFAVYLFFFAPRNFDFNLLGQWSSYNLITVLLIVAAIYWFLDALIFYYSSEYGITNKRVVMKTGWIRRHSLEIMVEKVEGVLVDQSVMGRVLGYGIITIIGTGGTKDRFTYIPDPLSFRKVVQQQIDILDNPERE